MKKVLSLVLVALMLLTCVVPATALVEPVENIPTICIRGDGNDIYDASGEKVVWPVSLDDEGDSDQLIDSVMDVIFPHLIVGLTTGNYEGYYDAFYDAIVPLFDDSALDCNGEVSNGTQVDPGKKAVNILEIQNGWDKKTWHEDGFYHSHDYTFVYDWRLSPLETVAEFRQYINDVMRVTGAKKVNIHGICLGNTVVTAFLDSYVKELENGEEPYIKNVMFDASVANGCLIFTDAFRGKIDLDAEGLQRFLEENLDPDEPATGDIAEMLPFLNELVFASYDMLKEAGVVDTVFRSVEAFYEVIYEGLVPKLAIAGYATFPGYWASVSAEHYEEARDFVFADPEMRTQYAGLIEKLDAYYTQVSSRSEEILFAAQEKGVHLGFVAKYGTQTMPFIESQNEVGDRLVAVSKSTYGATCSAIRGQLSQEYIDERTALGYGDYISADKKIDLSTSLFKDNVWIIKNCSHDHWSHEDALVQTFLRSTGMTTLNDDTYPRFMVCDGKTNDELGNLTEMTEENPGEDIWNNTPANQKSTLWTKILSFFNWFAAIFKNLFGMMGITVG